MGIKYTKTDELDKLLSQYIDDVGLDEDEIKRRTDIAEKEAERFITLEQEQISKKEKNEQTN
ncbi:hypothetical protein [Vagococcus lutrae]|uniref:hypothetical protein n=1 Tax=Vagococcus lutrae TaxID=81947 RepID=UPI0019272FB8|nr:hypothetical protein [Vagococcus lutrae]MDO5741520.1 hypothetical protein [Vagococcus sp.]MDT2807498.1 hypothetical protein [Vagococcus lutrae]MDT2823251.1 hypothetical protein [Vagococcus lutrae]MDT2825347.1 hypothetical protein [Vagococcus lutrae]MDY3706850.1 hypothetical protein [Vagococcus lutrae]